jgi:hypothetical protein
MNETRQHAHQLIDRMPETQLSGLVQFLETIVNPVATALRSAPLDDEPETDDEKAALAEAKPGSSRTGARAFLTPRPCVGSDGSEGDRMDRGGLGRHGRSR